MATVHPTVKPIGNPWHPSVRKQINEALEELGLVVIAWNELHHELGRLFQLVVGIPNMVTALAVWNSTENDRAQRKMIRAALPTGLSDLLRAKEKGPEWVDTARAEIKWILDRADSLADQRNDAAHSPFICELENDIWKLTSSTFFGHPRAKKLTGKDLQNQFKWYWQNAQVLAAYTRDVFVGLYAQPYSWPDRPSLPPLQPTPKPPRQKSEK